MADARRWARGAVGRWGWLDGGSGTFFANAGQDVHAVGLLSPLVEGHVGCIVIAPDGSRELARAVRDPLAEQERAPE